MSTIDVVLIVFCTLFYVGIGSLTALVFDTAEAVKKFSKKDYKLKYLPISSKIVIVLTWPFILIVYIFTKDVKALEL